jgi:hypothetical protein
MYRGRFGIGFGLWWIVLRRRWSGGQIRGCRLGFWWMVVSISCAFIFFQANTLGLMLERYYLLHTSPLNIEMFGFLTGLNCNQPNLM